MSVRFARASPSIVIPSKVQPLALTLTMGAVDLIVCRNTTLRRGVTWSSTSGGFVISAGGSTHGGATQRYSTRSPAARVPQASTSARLARRRVSQLHEPWPEQVALTVHLFAADATIGTKQDKITTSAALRFIQASGGEAPLSMVR
ncbi:MAG: hypothetical protein H0U59_04420 [Gemmatimonadaceae bacterium]|nr:hypothetical protein [Gemmatimonadaceae bacterium]